MAGPLDGVRILDLTTVVMGPYATQILADLGADVVKVEPPEGDVMRYNAPMRSQGMGHIFLNANRNKRSVVLDLKKDAGRAACLAIAKSADVLVYNIRPQAMARLRLSYDDLRAVNPRLIYVGAFGYSQRGPYAAKAAYDDLIQGAAGLPWLAQRGRRGDAALHAGDHRRPLGRAARRQRRVRRALPPRKERRRPARGRADVREPAADGPRRAHGRLHLRAAERRRPATRACWRKSAVPTKRRTATSACWSTTTSNGRRSSRVIGRPELLQDPRYATQEARSRDFEGAYALVAEEMAKRSTAEWLAALEAADIPVQRMNSLEDIVDDPHLAAIGYFREVEHPTEGRIRSMAVPSEWSESAPEYRRHAPRLGEHTREVLREAGLADAAIERMIAQGAARSI